MRLLDVPIEDTRGLLSVPLAQWVGPEGQCFVPRCAGIVAQLRRHLQAGWGVDLGALAPAAPGRPTSLGTVGNDRPDGWEDALEASIAAQLAEAAAWAAGGAS
jgi:hypothetical protein